MRDTVVLSPHPRNGDPNHYNSPDRIRPYRPNATVLRPVDGRTGCQKAPAPASEPHCILDIAPNDVASMVHFYRRISLNR